MAKIPYVKSGEPLVGADNSLGRDDTVNRPLRGLITALGLDPDGEITPFASGGGETIAPAASIAARDALYPTPAANTKVVRTDTQAVETYSGTVWVPGETKRSENPVSYGADTTGATSSSAAFTAADAKGRDLAITKGTYLFSTNATLTRTLRFEQGAILKPAAGVTLTITGAIDAGSYQLFDLSLGGRIDCTGNTKVHSWLTAWWGVGTFADDGPVLTALFASIPQIGSAVKHPPCVSITLATAVLQRSLRGVSFTSGMDARNSGSPVIYWKGRSGGRVIIQHRCHQCRIEGFFFRNAGRGGSVFSITAGGRTLTDSSGLLTQTDVGRNILIIGAGLGGGDFRSTITAVTNGTTATLDPLQNAATGTVSNSQGTIMPNMGACIEMDGNAYTHTTGATLSLAAGSRTLTDSAGGFTALDQWRDISIPGAGPGGQPLVTMITGYTNATTVTLDADLPTAVSTVSNVIGTIGGNEFGSTNTVRYCHFLNEGQGAAFVGVDISPHSVSNHEYHVVAHNSWDGYTSGPQGLGLNGTISGGSLSTLTVAGATFTTADIGKRIRIANAGPAVPSSSAFFAGIVESHDTRIAGVTSSTVVTLASPASRAVSGAFVVIGEWLGTGIRIGNSSNAKGQLFHTNQFAFLAVGIRQIVGSYFSRNNSFSGCEVCHWMDGNAEPCSDSDGNTEQCPVYLYGGGVWPFSISGLRHNVAPVQLPNRSAFHLLTSGGGSPGVLLDNVAFQSASSMLAGSGTGAYIFHALQSSPMVAANAVTYEALSPANFQSYPFGVTTFFDSTRISGYGGVVTHKPIFVTYDGAGPAVAGRYDPRNSNGGIAAGIRGETSGGKGFNGYGVAIQGASAVEGTMDNGEYVAVQGLQPSPTAAGGSSAAVALDATSPNFSGLGISIPATGIRIKKQNGTNVSVALGIDQQDTGDLNKLMGVVQHGSGRILKTAAASSTAYTPDAGVAEEHRIATGTFLSINAPLWRGSSTIPDGAVLRIRVRNFGGSAITPTLDALFRVGTMPAVPAGSVLSFMVIYDSVLAKWVLAGAMGGAV